VTPGYRRGSTFLHAAHGIQTSRLFVITLGSGVVPEGVGVGPERARPGDRILVSGPVASHGVAV